ncbi:MAG: carboxylesterase/lipase family protein [Promethearchaeota archaeon]
MVIVKTTKGEIKGVQESNYQCFLGIPFAKPPLEDLRFREPQPMDSWDDIKDATQFGSIPPQNNKDNPPINQNESEDCLYLNIWTPAADKKARVVMFWIYGGGFVIGASSRDRLNGARLAVHGDVVVVNFNYRLGALGFLNLPGIPPNIGIQDQIAALKWVNENIKQFGGDPNNITIFGESAGAGSVAILLAIPASRGLFHKAIMESGTANPKGFGPRRPREGAEEFLAKLRIEKENINDLRKLPLKKIMRAQKRIAGGLEQIANVPFRPFIDGKIIPEHPLEIIRKGKASNVPIIIGSNRDELAFISLLLNQATDEGTKKSIMRTVQAQIRFFGIEKQKLDKIMAFYKEFMEKKYPNNPYKYLDAFISDCMFGIPVIRNIEAYLKYQPNIYCYIFTYGSRIDGTAFHTIEIPFVFGNLDTTDTQKGAIGTGEEELQLAKNVMDAWVAFARTGNPNHDGLPEWSIYDLKRRAIMMLGINSKVEDDPIEDIRKAWDDII